MSVLIATEGEPIQPQQGEVPRLVSIVSDTSYTGGSKSDWTLSTPAGVSNPPVLMIVGGYLGSEFLYTPIAEAAVNADLAVVTMDPPRSQKADRALNPAHLTHPERLLGQMVRRIVIDLNESHGVASVHATGHSMGGPAVIAAAERLPERFESVTLWGSAGVSKHGAVLLGSRTPEIIAEAWGGRDQLKNHFAPDVSTALRSLALCCKYVTLNPIRTASEALAVSRSDSSHILKRLRQLGVKTGALAFQDDPYFRADEVAAKIAGIVDVFKVLSSTGHIAPQLFPELVMKAQSQILKEYEADDFYEFGVSSHATTSLRNSK